MSGPDLPSVTAGVTAPGCAACGRALGAGRADRRFCSPACRQRAHRLRARRERALTAPTRRPKAETVYQCPDCQERLLGEQRCEDCNRFCRRLGAGAECPCCGEAIAIAERIDAGA